jgi:hypothetical protein
MCERIYVVAGLPYVIVQQNICINTWNDKSRPQ